MFELIREDPSLGARRCNPRRGVDQALVEGAGKARGVRILIDGADLTGKTTLSAMLAARLGREGYRVHLLKGRLFNSRIMSILSHWDANRHADSALLNAAYIGAALLDRFKRRKVPRNHILICESYVQRAIAYGLAFHLSWVPSLALLLEFAFPRFEMAVLLESSLDCRRRRFIRRQTPTAIDARTIESIEVHDAYQQAFRRVFKRYRRHLIVDTTDADPAANIETILKAMRVTGVLAPIVPGGV